MIRKGFLGIFILVLWQFSALAQEMVFSAEASAQQVGTKDQFQVTFILTNPAGASNFRPPSFSGFTVVGGPYQSNNSNVTITNGQVKQVNSLNTTYVLVPNKAGLLTIGPAKVSYNGHDVASNAINIQAVNGSVARQQRPSNGGGWGDDDAFAQMDRMQREMDEWMNQMMQQSAMAQRQQAVQQQNQMEERISRDLNKIVFIRVQVDKTSPYVGEQITATYKLYSRLPMQGSLTGLPSLNGFWSQDYELPKQAQPFLEKIDGQDYQVFILKKSALFPQQSGVLTLDPAKAEGVITYYSNVPFKIASVPVKINVKPLPAEKQPASFTGAVGDFTIDTKLDKNTLSTDDAASLVFTIKGSGNFKLIGNPKLEFPAELGAYEPQITDTITSRNPAITGSKIFTYNMNPQTPGDYTIPAIRFSYYDVAAGAYKEVATQPLKVHVTKGKHYNPNVAKSAPITDIHDIDKTTFAGKNGENLIAAKPWYWSLYGISVLGLIGLMVRRKQQEVYAGNQALFRNKKANKIAWKRLATARKLLPQEAHKAFYEEVSKAIWLYLSDKLGIPLSHLSKETVEDELRNKQVPVAQINNVKNLVLECEMALYSPSGGQQQRQHTLDQAAETIGDLENVLKNKKNAVQYTSIFCLFLMMGMGLNVAVAKDNDAVLWQQANQLYAQKNYDSAVKIYEALLKEHTVNAQLHYNTGNAYFRLNRIGLAVLHYEKAARLEPSDKEISDNLLLARSKVQGNMQETAPIFFVAWWNTLNRAVSANTWAVLALIAFLSMLTLIYLASVKKSGFRNAGRWVTLSIVLVLLCGAMTWISYDAYAHPGKAVITSTNAVFLQSPQGNGKVIGSLPEGLVVDIAEKQNGYYNITLQNGTSGWIALTEMQEI